MALRVAFIVGIFPAASETFITGQIAGLLDRGVDVRIYSFRRGDATYAAEAYARYGMASRTTYLDFPERWIQRAGVAMRAFAQLLLRNPRALVRVLNILRFGADAWSLKLLCWAGPLAAMKADIVHCHFGPIADNFRMIRRILDFHQPWLTTFYGYDVSQVPRQKGSEVYRLLAQECPKFFVMSEDMKRRVVALGFAPEKVHVHPVGIDIDDYPRDQHARALYDGVRPVQIVSVARLVEKKGVDDLLRALASVRKRTTTTIACTIVGDGPLRVPLQRMARELGVEDMVTWTGSLRQEDMICKLNQADIYVQPSKTSSTGDME